VIREQAERMADIVKKIGRITKYETMPYVGGAAILDLERSTAGDVPSLSGDHGGLPATPSSGTTPVTGSGDDSLDGSRTREFSAVQPDPELLALLEIELIDDPAAADDSPASSEATRVVKAPKR
jgi:hypothetical protein